MQRPDLYVVARFLDVLYRSGQPMKKTNIQMIVGLNYPRFVEYLNFLLARGMIQRADAEGIELYSLSPKGLDSYHKLVDLIRDTMTSMKP